MSNPRATRPTPKAMYKTLRKKRRFVLLPHSILRPLSLMLAEQAELLLSLGVEFEDARWTAAGVALTDAAALVREAAR